MRSARPRSCAAVDTAARWAVLRMSPSAAGPDAMSECLRGVQSQTARRRVGSSDPTGMMRTSSFARMWTSGRSPAVVARTNKSAPSAPAIGSAIPPASRPRPRWSLRRSPRASGWPLRHPARHRPRRRGRVPPGPWSPGTAREAPPGRFPRGPARDPPCQGRGHRSILGRSARSCRARPGSPIAPDVLRAARTPDAGQWAGTSAPTPGEWHHGIRSAVR